MSYDSISGKTLFAGKHAKKSSSTTNFRAKKTPSELNDEAIKALHSSWEHPLPRYICRIPKKKMLPSRRICESLGFTFTPSKNSSYYTATMPAGWRVESSGSDYKLYIVDAKGFRRGEKNWYFHSSDFTLFRRYNITSLHLEQDTIGVLEPDMIEVIVEDSDGKVIHSAGYCSELGSDEYNKLEEDCRDYLQKNFPDWKEYDAYWD